MRVEAAVRPGESEVQRSAGSRVGATIAYYGDAARVREGFAIALGLLGLSAGMVDGLTRDHRKKESDHASSALVCGFDPCGVPEHGREITGDRLAEGR